MFRQNTDYLLRWLAECQSNRDQATGRRTSDHVESLADGRAGVFGHRLNARQQLRREQATVATTRQAQYPIRAKRVNRQRFR